MSKSSSVRRVARGPAEAPLKVYDQAALAWTSAGKDGLSMKVVRRDEERGRFLGMIGFEACVRTGVHQHLDMAFSYLLAGALTDYSGTAVRGEMGINFAGSTHDAIAYEPSLMVSRLEGPVLYGPEAAHVVHAGALRRPIRNTTPEMLPEVNVPVAALPAVPTVVGGVARRLICDYPLHGFARRSVHLQVMPGSSVPPHVLSAPIEWYLLAGDVRFAGRRPGVTAHTGCFVVFEEGAEVAFHSQFGASLIAWADGPSRWLDVPDSTDLYGFRAAPAAALRSAR